LADVTAPSRIWAVPTLLRGSVVAAHDTPPTARNSAIDDMTLP
jgi:hypothetical protein